MTAINNSGPNTGVTTRDCLPLRAAAMLPNALIHCRRIPTVRLRSLIAAGGKSPLDGHVLNLPGYVA